MKTSPLLIALLVVGIFCMSGCSRQDNSQSDNQQKNHIAQKKLYFQVKNFTGKTIYVTCFSYIKENDFTRWHWDKSEIHKLENNEQVIIDIDSIPDQIDRENVFGYLAVFDSYEQADEAIYELLDGKTTIDLDLLHKLKNKRVVIGVEQYGFKGEKLDPNIETITREKEEIPIPELDFYVENQTENPLYVTCFVYQRKETRPTWRFDKTPVVRIEPGGQALVDVDTIVAKYDRIYVRGHLGVFGVHEKKEAEESTYELLAPKNKVKLGSLAALKGKRITLTAEKYGVLGDSIDYTIKQ